MSEPITFFQFEARLRRFIRSCCKSWGVIAHEAPPSRAHVGIEDLSFDRLALELFALQFEANAPFRRFCVAQGVSPENAGQGSGIPAVPTGAWKEFDFSCLAEPQRTHVFCSSGTTRQKPSRHFHNRESLGIYEISLWPWFARHLVAHREGDWEGNGGGAAPWRRLGLMALTPSRSGAPHSSLVYMFDTIRRELGGNDSVFCADAATSGDWSINPEAALGILETAVQNERPLMILGPAFSFVHLLDELAGKGVKFALPPGSRVMETGGYKGRAREIPKAELHGAMIELLGIPSSHIVCEYGMCELSSQAYDWRVGEGAAADGSGGRVFHFPPWARARVISSETGREVTEGETGLIRVFDLANVFSVMAVQTEDLATRRGDGFELVGRARESEVRGCSLMLQ